MKHGPDPEDMGGTNIERQCNLQAKALSLICLMRRTTRRSWWAGQEVHRSLPRRAQGSVSRIQEMIDFDN